jgi:predicted transcriptional regulator
MVMRVKQTMSFEVDAETAERLREVARREDRSISSLIRIALGRLLEATG